MDVNREKFFKEVTLRICGSLQINMAFQRAFDYLREYFPVDQMFLDIADTSLGANRHIAFATSGENPSEEIIPLSERLWEWVRGLKEPFILNGSDDDETIREFVPLINLQGKSDLSLPLRLEGELVGFLVLRSFEEGRFTPEHVELLRDVAEPFAIALANALAHESVLKNRDTLIDDNRFLTNELLSHAAEEIIGANSGLKNVMDMVRQVAPLSNTVILLGETGAGKEVIANAIHFASSRKDGPFIKVNCGAIPETLIDSELFGHEKGAFTGALVEKRGRFERATGGTIFFDEIGELPIQAQVRLLRVIQDREIERVGGDRPIPVDIRVIAATHRNLESMVSESKFREDLWFRLNVFPIIVPPLRHRKEDIPALTRYFVQQKSRELGISQPPSIGPGALGRLTNYSWPGNVRELENLIERELIRDSKGPLMFSSHTFLEQLEGGHNLTGKDKDGPVNLDEVISLHIGRVLRLAKGKIYGTGGAAELLGVNPSTLRGKMIKLGLNFKGSKKKLNRP